MHWRPASLQPAGKLRPTGLLACRQAETTTSTLPTHFGHVHAMHALTQVKLPPGRNHDPQSRSTTAALSYMMNGQTSSLCCLHDNILDSMVAAPFRDWVQFMQWIITSFFSRICSRCFQKLIQCQSPSEPATTD